MMKYLVGLGVLIVVGIGYFLLAPADNAPVPEREFAVPASKPEPAPAAPVAPAEIVARKVPLVPSDEDKLLEDMAADTRESLPRAVTGTVTLTDALFLPRMRIMEYTYVTTAADARTSSTEMRTVIEASAKTICLEGRRMFQMGATLRNSFEDRDGNLFQRVYLLPEDCREFY